MNERISGPDLDRIKQLLDWLGRKFPDGTGVDSAPSLENMPAEIESLKFGLASVAEYHNAFLDLGLHAIPTSLPAEPKDQIRLLIEHKQDLYRAVEKIRADARESQLLKTKVDEMTGLDLQDLILYSLKRADRNNVK